MDQRALEVGFTKQTVKSPDSIDVEISVVLVDSWVAGHELQFEELFAND